MSNDKKNTSIVCSKCNMENITDNKFCYNCGNSLFNGNDSSNDVENNSDISVKNENTSKKKPDFSVLGLFASLIPLLIFFNVFGVIIFIILTVIYLSSKNDNNPLKKAFHFMGSGCLMMIIFCFILFGMCFVAVLVNR